MEFSESDRVEYRDRFIRTTAELSDDAIDVVKRYKASASYYVYGWQDAQAGVMTDTLYGEMFGYAYATVRALYMLGRSPLAPSPGWAWRKFQETGHITELVSGKEVHLDLIPLSL